MVVGPERSIIADGVAVGEKECLTHTNDDVTVRARAIPRGHVCMQVAVETGRPPLKAATRRMCNTRPAEQLLHLLEMLLCTELSDRLTARI